MVNPLRSSSAPGSKLVTWNARTKTIKNKSTLKQIFKHVATTRNPQERQQSITDAASKAIRASIISSLTEYHPMNPTITDRAAELESKVLTKLDAKAKIDAGTVKEALDSAAAELRIDKARTFSNMIIDKEGLYCYIQVSKNGLDAAAQLYATINSDARGRMDTTSSLASSLIALGDDLRSLERQVQAEINLDRSLLDQVGDATSLGMVEQIGTDFRRRAFDRQNEQLVTLDEQNTALARDTISIASRVADQLEKVLNGSLTFNELSNDAQRVLRTAGYRPSSARVANQIHACATNSLARIKNEIASLTSLLHLENSQPSLSTAAAPTANLPGYQNYQSAPGYTSPLAPPSYSEHSQHAEDEERHSQEPPPAYEG